MDTNALIPVRYSKTKSRHAVHGGFLARDKVYPAISLKAGGSPELS